MKTVKEKYEYNKKINTSFARGYLQGVEMYKNYNKKSVEHKKQDKEFIDIVKQSANLGVQNSKGIMCAFRDCANERKETHNKSKKEKKR